MIVPSSVESRSTLAPWPAFCNLIVEDPLTHFPRCPSTFMEEPMASRAEKVRRRQRRKDKKRRGSFAGLEFAPSGPILVFDPPDKVKMSEVLSALLDPEWHECRDEEALRKLLTLG